MNPLNSTNLTYENNPRNVLVTKSETGAVMFDGESVSLPPFEAGTLRAEEAPTSTDQNPEIRVIAIGGDGTERKIIFNRKKAFFWFKSEETGNERISTAATRTELVAEVVATLNDCFAPVTGATEIGPSDLIGEQVCFSLDATSTSIIFDTGHSYGVNTIKAVPEGGTITIKSILGDRTLHTGLEVGHGCKADGSVIPGGLNDVVNYLNELFTVGPFEAVVITDPFSTMIADVDGVDAGYTLEGTQAADPAGTDIFVNQAPGNYAGLKSTATIDQAGEYFTFDIRNLGQIGFGLVHSDASYAAGKYRGNATYADPSQFAVGNSAHYGFQFSHWFHPTPKGSWTNYGADTSYVTRPGWSNWDQKQDFIDGNPVKIRVGLDHNGYISVESLQDDGTWVVHARTTYVVTEGAEFHLGIKAADSTSRVYSAPKVHLLEPEAPTMQFRWIESPDGTFVYPLFATAEEANYYDEITNGLTAGTGTSHTHDYADDPTDTDWYMPETVHDPATYHHTSAPTGWETFNGNPINWTPITSLNNADLAPPLFDAADVTAEEGTAVNIQINPQDHSWSTSVSISPSGSGLVWDGYSMVQGTLADVGADTVYTVTVTRGNSYGSSTGSMTVTATDVAPIQTLVTPWTKALDFSGSSERAVKSSNFNTVNPINQTASWTVALPNTAGNTTHDLGGRPWAVAMVFKSDGNSSNQHIWNFGEGAGNNDDNIYVRQDASGNMYFGWGRSGALNECRIGNGFNTSTQQWYGLYVGYTGARLSGANATAANLADCFDIRFMRRNESNNNVWEILTGGFGDGVGNRSTTNNWNAGTTGARMDRSVIGELTLGGRGSNRSFHGKIASFVETTLIHNRAMPSDAEIGAMITDPLSWLTDYKDGEQWRLPQSTSWSNNFQATATSNGENYATSVWLMGDGTNDSFSNMIRNQVRPADQNYSKLNMISMVSNDIQNVSIPGLT